MLTPDTVPEGEEWVFFGLTAEDYEKLALTFGDTIRYLRESDALLTVYERDIRRLNDDVPETED